jgi:alpha-tubulin suppressor-like RCC1 family protein
MGVLGRGNASKTPTGTPAPVEGAIDAVAVATGNKHACLVDTSGAVWCWGDDRWGALGRGRVTWRDEPARVVDIGP